MTKATHPSLLDDEMIKVANFLGGEEAVVVVRTLAKLKEATDESIATESGIRVNNVRKMLYNLYGHALVTCTRVRDEKTGWYIFYWRLQPDQLDAFIRSRKKRTLEKLKSRLSYETAHSFFVCKTCAGVRVTFEDAMESAFRCTNCGKQLLGTDNSEYVEALTKTISNLEAELNK